MVRHMPHVDTRSGSLRPNIFLVDTAAAHTLDNLFSFLLVDASLFGNDLAQNLIDLSSHMSGITANVEVGLLLEKLIDQFSILFDLVLHVDLLCLFSREGVEDGEFVAKGFLVFLSIR